MKKLTATALLMATIAISGCDWSNDNDHNSNPGGSPDMPTSFHSFADELFDSTADAEPADINDVTLTREVNEDESAYDNRF